MDWAARKKIAAEAPSFALLDPGVYSFIVKEKPTAKDRNGWPSYTINPSVEAGPRANARVFHTFYTTEKPGGMRFFFESLKALGIPEEFFDSNPSDEQVIAALHGKRFTAEVTHEDYNGKPQQRLGKFAPAVGVAAAAGTPAAGGPGVPAAAPAAQFAPAAPVAPAAPAQPVAAAAAPANPWGTTVTPPPGNPFAQQ
jgi:hypothetical protein